MLQRPIILIAQIATGLALFIGLEGFAYLEQGYGIHPILAGALVAVLLVVPHLLPIYRR